MANHDTACHDLPDLADLEPLLTIRRVCQVLGCHDRTVRRWIAEGLLRVLRAGGRLLIARSELSRFLVRGEAVA
jgi:excisionase family DNA binding protein